MTQTATVGTSNWHTASLDSPVDGIPIRFAFLKPKKTPTHAVLMMNGRSEWVEKYFDLPDFFQLGDETLWITLDHRGQGESGGPRAYVATYDDFANDAAAAVEAVAEDLPYAIVSHSMGGLIAMHGTLSGILKPKALALCSPLFSLPRKPLPHSIAQPFAELMAKTRYSQQPSGFGKQKEVFEHNPLTSSISGFDVVRYAPYPFISPTFGWVEATFAACAGVLDPERLKGLKVPVRILGGSDERVIDPCGWSNFCMAAAQVTEIPIDFTRIAGGRHELLNEIPRIKKEAIRLLKAWLERYLTRF